MINDDILSRIIDRIKEGKEVKLIGRVFHNRTKCKLCKQGDKAEIIHPYHFIQISLPYLRSQRFKITGKEKGRAFETGIDAWNYLKEIQQSVKDKTFIPWNWRGKSKSISLFRNYYLEHKAKKYRGFSRYFEPIWEMDLAEINQYAIKQFYRQLPESLKTSTKNTILRVLRATLKEAYEDGIVTSAPASIRKDKADKPKKQALTWDEQMQVIQCAPDQHKPLLIFLACHGKRSGEALSLRWEDIDFKEKTAWIHEHKVKEKTLLALHSLFLANLPPIPIDRKGYVFPQVTTPTVCSTVKAACKKAGVKVVSAHEFGRHSFVTNKKLAGWTFEQIAMVTNNYANIKHYDHIQVEQQRALIESDHQMTTSRF